MPHPFRSPANERVGANLRSLRTKKGMSQADLARAMTDSGWPWHQQTVAQTESGKRPIRVDELEVISDVFGVTAGQLLWEPAEVNASQFVYGAGNRVTGSWENLVLAVLQLMSARSFAGRTLSQHRRSKYERVQGAIEETRMLLRESTLDAAIWEGIQRWNDRDSAVSADD